MGFKTDHEIRNPIGCATCVYIVKVFESYKRLCVCEFACGTQDSLGAILIITKCTQTRASAFENIATGSVCVCAVGKN